MPHLLTRSLFLTITLLLSAEAGWSQRQVRFRNQTVSLIPYTATNASRSATEPTEGLWLVQWASGGTNRPEVVPNGFEVVSFFPEGVALVYQPKGHPLADLHKSRPIGSLAALQPSWKADADWLRTQTGLVKAVVSFPAQLSGTTVSQALQQLGASHLQSVYNGELVEFEIPAAALPGVLSLPYIITVGPAARRVPLNSDERGYSGAAVLSLPVALGGEGLLGDSLVIGIGDNTSPLYHVDLADRTLNNNPEPAVNHGVHVSGTAAGAGIVNPAGRGMAPRATVIAELYDLVLQKTPQLHQSTGMTLTNNSYAAVVGDCNNVGLYDVYAQQIDQLVMDNPDVLHVVAAGNDGALQCAPAPGFGNIPGGFQPSKNSLVVGNVEKDMKIYSGSSRGPVRDGRLKPEICAFGTSVFSCLPNNRYVTATGTSMATPAVTGAAALLTQRYRQLQGGAQPTAVLLKGLLTGCADDQGNPGPDYRYGMGMFNLARAVKALEENRYRSFTISPAATTHTITFSVPANLAQAKVLLVWNDPAATPLAAKALLNDLDLSVTDPSGTLVKPLVLNPANPSANAQPGTDTLNNIEQVVINNPAAGTYTVAVNGRSLTGTTLPAVVVYEYVEKGIRLLKPAANVPVAGGAQFNIYWESPERNAGSFTLDYSTDNGSTWTAIGSVADSLRAFFWPVPAISTSTAQVRVRRGTETVVSGTFVINVPPVVTLSSQQCAGYMGIDWTAVPGATGYEILHKKGSDMVAIDSVLATTYMLANLPYGDRQYIAVRPLINGLGGYRSLAVSRMPDSVSNCGAFANNDLAMDRMVTATTGRILTQSAYTSNQAVVVSVRNNGPVAAGYQIHFRIGTGAWQQSASKTIAANATDTITLPGQNLAQVGTYPLTCAIVNTSGGDPVSGNDSLQRMLRQLPNAPVDLAANYLGTFEGYPRINTVQDTSGLFDGSRWDYDKADSGNGRFRNLIDTTMLLAGDRSISLDADRFSRTARNAFKGTFNMAAYNVQTTEIRAEFDYMQHGDPQNLDSNSIYIRGTDTDPWIRLYAFDTTLAEGVRRNTGSISLSDVLRNNGQQLSTSTAIVFRQQDTTVIAAPNYGCGYTFDNLRMYTVGNDISLVAIEGPQTARCGLDTATSVTLRLANGTLNPQYNVPVVYRLDNGGIQTSIVPYFGPKDTLLFTFPQRLGIQDFGPHRIDAWVAYGPDVFRNNDSILNYVFQAQPLIATFPYLEHFDTGRGYWYAEGQNSSWQWGTPASPQIQTAASGTNAWKTGLVNGYNDNERSYLYSPCFDLTGMSKPQLSFSLAYDFENCGNTVCDAAWMEYSTDSKNWSRLGLSVEGFNWYDSLQHRAWTGQGQYRWRVATITLPTWLTEPVRLRFVMRSDANTHRKGIAIDDIHIYDRTESIYSGPFAQQRADIDAQQDVIPFRKGNQIFTRIFNNGFNLGSTLVRNFSRQQPVTDPYTKQVYLPRQFIVQTANPWRDSLRIDFYITDRDVVRMVADTSCADCAKAADAYRLGMLTYMDDARVGEDSTLSNNSAGSYRFRPYTRIEWVPYDSGYIAHTSLQQPGELWFAPYGTNYAPEGLTLDFTATRTTETQAALRLKSYADTAIRSYEIYRSVPGRSPATKIYEVNSRSQSPVAVYETTDTPPAAEGDSVRYQAQWVSNEGIRFYGSTHTLVWLGKQAFQIYPNPAPGGAFTLLYNAPIGSVLQVQVTDISGRVVYRTEQTSTVYQTVVPLVVPVRAGVYFLEAVVGGTRYREKILIL
ncbi:MAG: T9SS type A sorting domain-containing protein [Sphingobacteriales bacterium]|nr:MAG: T9SS type A sorting domain-containing protein [Sphingobacteriales bacterium]